MADPVCVLCGGAAMRAVRGLRQCTACGLAGAYHNWVVDRLNAQLAMRNYEGAVNKPGGASGPSWTKTEAK